MKVRRLNFALLASLLATLAAASLTAAIFHLAGWGRPTSEQALAELRLATDTSLADRLRQLATPEDEYAIELLVRALGHERLTLRQAARDVLADRLDRWSLLSKAEASSRANILARELRLQTRQLPEDVRPFVADTVTRLLLLPGEPHVEDCIATLRQLGPATRREVTPPLADSTSPTRSQTSSDSTRTAGRVPARQ